MIRLNEIIWEIIPTCNKGCSYCGSKQITSLDNSNWLKPDEMIKVIDNLYSYCPDVELNISGGEPGLLIQEQEYVPVFNYLMEKFPKNIKIVTNGEFIKTIENDYNTDFEVNSTNQHINFKNIAVIGLSFNDIKEKEYIEGLLESSKRMDLNITIITNFGNHNIFDFKEIYEVVKKYNCGWQVQLTYGNELLVANGIKHLRELIYNLKDKNIVMADDLQEEHNCSAGVSSCGITYKGDIIGCLAERTFNKEDLTIQGNLLDESIKEIWENEFKDCRFGCRKCCRDFIEYPEKEKTQLEICEETVKVLIDSNKNKNKQSIILSYGVITNKRYGVFKK